MAVVKKRINYDAIANPEAMLKLLNAIDTEIDALRTVANELRTDHATAKTTVDAIETLIEELHDDHATQKTSHDAMETLIEELHDDHATQVTFNAAVDTLLEELADDHATMKTSHDAVEVALEELMDDHATLKTSYDAMETLIEELHDDHATQKTSHDAVEVLIEELHDDHAVIKTLTDEVDSDLDTIGNCLDFLQEPNGVIGGDFTIAATAAATLLGAGHVKYKINGEVFYADLDTTITLEDSGDIAQNKFGAWRIMIDRAGVVTAVDTGAQMAWDNAQDAMLNLAAVAPTANTATIGYVTITDSGGAFNIGTTNTSGGTATAVIYHVRGPKNQVSGLHTALGASIVADDGASTWSVGTVNVKRNGLYLTEIAAIASQAVDDADTIATTKFGGWLLVTDLAGTGVYLLAADGAAGAVSAMVYDSAALAEAALDTLVDQLPEVFVPIGKIVVENASAGLFTAGATNWNAADINTTETDATVGTWDRTASTGFDSHKVNPPTIPAVLAAANLATLTAPKPASGPDTLASAKPASGPATLTAPKPASGPATLTAPKPTGSGPATLGSAKPASGPATLTAPKPASGPATLTAAAVVEQVSKSL